MFMLKQIAALLLIPFFSYAQDSDTIKYNLILDEIIIRSFKQNITLDNTPISASKISFNEINQMNISNLKSLSSFIPNLFVPDYGSKLTSPIYIRGIGSKINNPSVGLYVDGVPFFEKSAFDFDFNEIDQVEVLRGPQGTLYGRNTMGGIINVYTKSPFKYEETILSISTGNYAQMKASASHYGNLNETFGYALSGNYEHTDGYFINTFSNSNADPQNTASGRIRLSWKTSPFTTIHLLSQYEYSNQGGYPYGVINKQSGDLQPINYNDYSFYKRNMLTNGLTATHRTENIQINSQTAFQYITDHQGIDQDFSPKEMYFVNQNQKQHMLSEEFNLKSSASSKYSWLFGAFGFYQGIENEVHTNRKEKELHIRKRYNMPSFGGAIYHQSTISDFFVKNLSLILGMRYDLEKTKTNYHAYENKYNEKESLKANFDSKQTFAQWTPKASLQYNLNPSSMLYTTISKGYKAGGFNTSFEKEEDRAFEPEYSWNYEVGSKLSTTNSVLHGSLTLFYIDWKNQQIYQSLPGGTGAMLKNAGKSASKGIELSIQTNPIERLGLQFNYGYTHATFKEYTRSSTLNYAKNYLPMVPSHTLSISADYSIKLQNVWVETMQFSTQYIGTGKIYWNEDNQYNQPFYGIVNMNMAFIKKHITLNFWIKNTTNTSYIAYFFNALGNGFAQKGRPLTCGAKITLAF